MISVIIPVYNVKTTLKKSVFSAINQTYRDIEVIIVDDGSTDGSEIICDDLSKLDKRIHVFHKDNGGLSSARNFGLNVAQGESVVFLDSDDFINKNFCEKLYALQKRYNADIVSSDIVKTDDINKIELLINSENDNIIINLFNGVEILKEYFYPRGNLQVFHTVTNKLYRKKLFDNVLFNEGKLHEDLYITNKLLYMSNCVVLTNMPYYVYYRGNKNSICKNYSAKNMKDQIDALKIIENSFICSSVKEEMFWFLMNQYYHLLLKCKKLAKDNELLNIKKIIKDWIYTNIKNCNLLSIKYKLRIFIALITI